MAALVEGQQYGLSAQDKINCTKSLVFVKLTDSALRSIEEYVKNKGDSISRPTIQFQNSNGVISLPQNGGSQNYGFTLSNVEADGPHGSFECLRQTGYRSLESLGCLQVKMHIHANEDSYENTRVKMAAVEKEQKKSFTKVIKPAGAHLGRKIKVKRPGLVVSPMKSSPPTASMAPKPILQPVKPVVAPPRSPPEPKPPSFHLKRPDIPKPNPPKKNPELMRQPIRDRIIHILAVRPYKRPELLVRLNHEGVREKDKNKLTSILPQLSILKGNIYYLANYLWNEVQDNWKFCTQEELEIIRKRKHQHLNNSSENEITPPSFSQPNNSPAQKRLSSDVMPNGNPRSKKQRISHYKGEPQRPSYNGTSELSVGTFNRKSPYSPGRASLSANSPEEDIEPSFHSSSSSGPNRLSPNFHPKTREDSPRIREDKPPRTREENPPRTREENPRIREDNPRIREDNPRIREDNPRIREDNPRIRDDNPRTREDEKGLANGINRLSPGVNQKENSRTKEDAPRIREDVPRIREDVPRIREDVPRIREDGARSRVAPPVARDKPPPVARKEVVSAAARVNNVSDTTLGKAPSQPLLSHPRPLESKSPQVSPDSNTPQKGGVSSKTASSNGYVNSISKNGYSGSQPSYVSNRSKVTSTTNGSCSNSPHSSCDSMEYTDTIQDIQVPPPNDSPEQCDSPEYEKEYGRILNSEQRAKYKAHFNAEYQEYLCLHEEIISISNKFANLERHLHTCTEGSPEFKKIKSKIFKEYRAYQQNPNYVENLKKFNFLHNKLAYIKRLVAEYDNAQCVKS